MCRRRRSRSWRCETRPRIRPIQKSLVWLETNAFSERSTLALSLAALGLTSYGRRTDEVLVALADLGGRAESLGSLHLTATALYALALPIERATCVRGASVVTSLFARLAREWQGRPWPIKAVQVVALLLFWGLTCRDTVRCSPRGFRRAVRTSACIEPSQRGCRTARTTIGSQGRSSHSREYATVPTFNWRLPTLPFFCPTCRRRSSRRARCSRSAFWWRQPCSGACFSSERP